MFCQNMDLSSASMVPITYGSRSVSYDEQVYLTHFKTEKDLEKNPLTSAKQCLKTFLQKGGTLQSIPYLSPKSACIRLHEGDAVYPICSGGWCRSQTLWAILQPFSHHIVLFPPHAARVGFDPYNGQINRYKNEAVEAKHDAFYSYFGMEKSLRFGFEHASEWKSMEESPTSEGLQAITQFYDACYFGPSSSWQGRQGKRRIYIAFSHNAHVTFYRLNQANERLEDVTVIAINSEDLITHPPFHIAQRSIEAYDYFSNLLKQQFDFSSFKQID